MREPQPFIGPVISATRPLTAVLAAQAELAEGRRQRRSANASGLDLARPTVSPGLIDVTDMPGRKDEEVFGPILQVIRVGSFEAALEEANRHALRTRRRADLG